MLESSDLAWRADSVNNFYEANRKILQLMLTSQKRKCESSRNAFECPASSFLAGTNLIGLSSTFGDQNKGKVSEWLKNNIVGQDCKIGKSKLTGCVVFNDVVIGDSCVLENCVLANSCVIGDGCELTNVLVAASQTVQSKSKLSNETVKKLVQFQ